MSREPVPAGRSRPWRHRALTAAVLAAVLAATLLPGTAMPGAGPDEDRAIAWLCLLCGERGAADAVLNVLLFLPLGLVLARGRMRPVAAWALCVLLSAGIETAQILLPGRHPSLSDLVFNGTGAALGLVAGRTLRSWLLPPRTAARPLGVAAALAAGAVLVGTGLLFQPSFPTSPYYGQWTARLGHLAAYEGRVLAARVGDLEAPSRRLRPTTAYRQRLRAGDPVSVRFAAGPPPEGLAPVFGIFDAEQREILLLGFDGHAFVLRHRTRGARLRLDVPDLRSASLATGLAPGDTVRLLVDRGRTGYRVRLAPDRAGAPGRAPAGRGVTRAREVRLAHSLGSGWAFLVGADRVPHGLRPVADGAWAALLLLPAGFWLRRRRDLLAAVGFVASGALVAAWALPLVELGAAAPVGLLVGAIAGRALARVANRAAATPPRARAKSRP